MVKCDMRRIYLVSNLNNGKVYIGVTCKTVRERWMGHVCQAREGRKQIFHAAIRKYGAESFSVRQIDYCASAKEAAKLETLYIGIYRATHRRYGYNSALGGPGLVPTEETRARMRISHLGKKRSAESLKKSAAKTMGVNNGMYRGDLPLEEIIFMYEMGYGLVEIAKKFGSCTYTITKRLRDYGVRIRRCGNPTGFMQCNAALRKRHNKNV